MGERLDQLLLALNVERMPCAKSSGSLQVLGKGQMETMWYKDGKKLSASSKVCLEAKGCP